MEGLRVANIATILDKPNANGITITKESFLKSIKEMMDNGKNLYITKTNQGSLGSMVQNNPNSYYDIIPADILGIIHSIDLESHLAHVEMISEEAETLIALKTNTFGFRAIGDVKKVEGVGRVGTIDKMICYDIIQLPAGKSIE